MDEDRYLRLTDLVRYSTLSIRTLRRYLDDPIDPLPTHRIGGRVLIQKSEFDAWLRRREQRERPVDAPTTDRAQLMARVAQAVKATRG